MPDVYFIHCRLNLAEPEAVEIRAGLAKISARQRSAAIRSAVLEYLRRHRTEHPEDKAK